MIQRFRVLLFAVLLSSTAIAGDLKLRVVTLGYEDAKEASDDRSQSILRSIETQISPGRKFSNLCRYGAEKIELQGSATHDKNSQLRIKLHYRHETTSFKGTSVQTIVSLKPGDSITVGGSRSVASNKNQDLKKSSEYRLVVALIDSDESKLEAAEPRDDSGSR